MRVISQIDIKSLMFKVYWSVIFILREISYAKTFIGIKLMVLSNNINLDSGLFKTVILERTSKFLISLLHDLVLHVLPSSHFLPIFLASCRYCFSVYYPWLWYHLLFSWNQLLFGHLQTFLFPRRPPNIQITIYMI